MSGAGRGWLRPVGTLVGVLVVYFTIPLRRPAADWSFAVSVALMLTGILILGWAITGQVRRQLRGEGEDLRSLVTLLALVTFVFALGFYMLEQSRPGEFAGMRTRMDSLYFTLTTMATVGYGDVHASGQVARAVVGAQLVFDVVFVGAVASVLTSRIRSRADDARSRSRSGQGVDPDDPGRSRSGPGRDLQVDRRDASPADRGR